MVNVGRAAASAFADRLAGDVIYAAVDFMKSHDAEVTEREYIRAHRDALITALNHQRDCLLAYFEQRFAERREALEQFYGLLRSAVEDDDAEKLRVSLTGILGIIRDNPLNDFAEFRQTWANPEYRIDL